MSPAHAFGWLNDQRPIERAQALSCCLELMGLCDEVWVFGDWEYSEGCLLEIAVAERDRMPVRFLTAEMLCDMKEAT